MADKHHPAASLVTVLSSPIRMPGAINPAVTQKNIRSTVCKRGWPSRFDRPRATRNREAPTD
jgi:hypothetical protein